jgi:hypothetical protein
MNDCDEMCWRALLGAQHGGGREKRHFIASLDDNPSLTGRPARVLVYGEPESTVSRLAWKSRAGTPLGEAAAPREYRGIRLSRDGRRIAAARQDPEIGANVWSIGPGGGMTKLTLDPSPDQNPLTGLWQAREMKIRPRADNVVEVHPLLPGGVWDWFCLDNVLYHGRTLTILWDKTGEKFHKGKGLRVLSDGREIAHSGTLARIRGQR